MYGHPVNVGTFFVPLSVCYKLGWTVHVYYVICCPLSFVSNLVDLNSKFDFVSVYLNGSYLANEMRMRNFLGFIISVENSVKAYPNGYFENLPAGVEQINCSTLKVSTRD